MSTKLGAHCIGGSTDARRLMQAGSPVIKLLDDYGLADVADLPHRPLVIGRVHRTGMNFDPNTLVNTDPVQQAQQMLVAMDSEIRNNPKVAAWELANEPSFGAGEDPATVRAIAWYAAFEAERTRLLRTKYDRGAVIGNFSTGQPDLPRADRLALWRAFEPALEAARRYNGILGLHEYWFHGPNNEPFPPGWITWLPLRYRWANQWMDESGKPRVPIVITEAGWDNLPTTPPGRPFRESAASVQQYMDSLAWYDREIQQDANVVGAVVFTFGRDWPSHNIEGTGLVDLMIAHAGVPAPIPVPPPTPAPIPPVQLQRGKPRVQYARTYLLFPQDASFELVNAAVAYAYPKRYTVGFSADDAGIGDLDNRRVIAVDAARWPGDLRQWFADNYPGVVYETLSSDIILPKPLVPPIIIPPGPGLVLPPVPPVGQYSWKPGKCLVGVHGRADGPLQEPDYGAVLVSQVEAVKLTSSARPENVDRLHAINPNMFIMVRLFSDFRNRVISSADFALWMEGDLAQFYNKGIRYFEIHNEPNLQIEGWQQSWSDGTGYARWHMDVMSRLRARFPEGKFGFPGLSPGWNVLGVRMDALAFLQQADIAVRASDWIGVHCYWDNETVMNQPGGGRGYEEYRRRYPGKLLFITEFSNPNAGVSYTTKGQQYTRYYQSLRNIPGLGAAFSFVLSASSFFPNEVWRNEDGSLTDIPRIIGQRV